MRLVTLIAFVLAWLTAPVLAIPVRAAEQSMIILDASGSMWAKISGKTKIAIARETLSTVLKSVPQTTALGLMVYGHREKGSCADIELAIPPAVGTEAAIAKFVNGVNPKGKTPLAASVRAAAEALKYTEDKATIILITDGLETCDADPCALATELKQQGVDFTVHVVGFGLTQEEGKQVACLAENTGGHYFPAADADELSKALAATVSAPPAPEPAKPSPAEEKPEKNVVAEAFLSEGGPSLADNSAVYWEIFKAGSGDEPEGDHVDFLYNGKFALHLPAGRYVATAKLDSWIERQVAFDVTDTAVATPKVVFDAGHVELTPKREAGGPDAGSDAALALDFGSYQTTYYGPSKFYAPAGSFKVKGSLGSASVEQEIAVEAGKEVKADIVIAAGVINNKAIYTEKGPEVDSSNVFFQVLSRNADINGERKRFGYTYGTGTKLDVPAGDYLLSAQLGSTTVETPFSIKGGEGKDVIVNLDAGVLAIKAPGAEKITVLSATKDIQGNRKELSYAFAEEHSDTLHPGDYLVQVTFKGDVATKEMPASVKAGERSEVTVQ
ncbi:MAG: hypothetical protein BGO05_27715 [Rhizobiales bacterium 63-7]|nr:VWA domain-containing protein [Hyphomicrobiales bacterium]OJU66013.1 MAG: hypothetical protein BGO05_27715 [Rhizobiales bacterium 63-7]